MINDFGIVAMVFGGLLLMLEIGFRLGRRSARKREAPSAGQVGAVQGAVLGLLGLLLGFSFAGAGARFLERQDLIVQEANAIGTALLRADMLEEPHRTRLREALAAYTRHRLAIADTLNRKETVDPERLAEVDGLQAAIWKAATEGVKAGGPAPVVPNVGLLVLPPVNDVIDLHTLRMAAGKKHLPPLVLWLLISSSGLSMAAIGFGCGLSGRRVLGLTWPLLFLIGTALWTTIDLDHPRAGLIRLSEGPLKALKFDGP